MTDSDGRSTFAVLYLGLALVSILLFFESMVNGTGLGAAGMIAIFFLLAVIFGITGMYKLLTSSKGKSNNDGENNIEKEKDRNSNVEIRIFNNKKMLAWITFTVLFIWILYLSST
jgi:hypothetical protein|tara:strand:+ start:99 stop:443 length:345 start_codon:yes stop_codon:yes gene_type:complete